ncbi:MAG: glycosyltransferase family 4 protein [Pirellulaceae bacterium]
MNILIVSNLYAPDFCGGAAQFTDLSIGLRDRGHDVTVYTTHPYYPQWRRKSDASVWPIQEETHEGIRVLRHGIYVPRNPSKLIPRLAYELSFTASLMRSLFRGPRYDAVMVFCPLLGAVIFAAARKLLRRETIWLNVQDIPTDASLAAGISKRGLFQSLAERFQRRLFSYADVWSTINPTMRERLQQLDRSSREIHLCPNWLIGPLADAVADARQTKRTCEGESPRLLYCGNIGGKQGLLQFCKTLQRSNLPFHFKIRGQGSSHAEIQSWLAEVADNRFSLDGFLDDEEFVREIAAADLFVVTEKRDAGFSFIPSKLIPSISIGTPLLAVSDQTSPLGQEVSKHQLGIHCTWETIESTLPHVLDRKELREGLPQFQANCLTRAKFYGRDESINRYERVFEQIQPAKGTCTEVVSA